MACRLRYKRLLLPVVLLSVIFAELNAWATTADAPWSDPVNLSSTPMEVSRYPAIAADRMGNVHVVWLEEAGTDDGAGAIYYTMWDGARWTPPVDIIVGNYLLLPSLATDPQGFIHLAYIETGHLYYSRAHAGEEPGSARSWSSPVELDPPVAPGDNSRWPEIHADDLGHVYLLYNAIFGTGGTEVRFISSSDGGKSWSQPVTVSNPGVLASVEYSDVNRLASAPSGMLYAIWGEAKPAEASATQTLQVWFARSGDSGRTWSVPLLLTDPDERGLAEALAVVVDTHDLVHVLWRRHDWAVIHQQSQDQGRTWSSPEPVPAMSPKGDSSAEGQGAQRYGGVNAALDSQGNIQVLYGLDDGVYQVSWNGSGWSEEELVAREQSPGLRDSAAVWPRLAIALGNEMHVVWYEGNPELSTPDLTQRLARGEYEIRYRRSLLSAPALPAEPFAEQAVPPAADTPPATSMTASPTAKAAPSLGATEEPVTSVPGSRPSTDAGAAAIALAAAGSFVVVGIVVLINFLGKRRALG